MSFYLFQLMFQEHAKVVAIKSITKKNLAKSQSLLGKEIKILKVSCTLHILNRFGYRTLEKIWFLPIKKTGLVQ